MVQYKRIKGGEKNELSGQPFTKEELESVCDLYIEIEGKGIHENNPKIHHLAENLNRTIRSVENQLLGFRAIDSGESGRQHFSKLIPEIWRKKQVELLNQKKNIPDDKIVQKDLNLDEFKFRISSQLKNIIGKELITDDYVAVFELVKNSFDAYAKLVKIIFEGDKITIQDDGKGMDKVDLITKWLFVAYSAKKDGVEDIKLQDEEFKSYRDKINLKSNYAGAKGIGRFSSDRLGATLSLITKTPSSNSLYWKLSFNWDDFEKDSREEFIDMFVASESSEMSPVEGFEHGTIIEISNLRSVWPRNKKLDLKYTLEKLINPFHEIDFNDGLSTFNIEIVSNSDVLKDNEIKSNKNYNPRDIVNGSVKNFIFETLKIKTTQIISYIDDSREKIITEIQDRGELIYKIEEPNNFRYLNSNTRIQFYYLNHSAKSNFTRLMGINPVNFGSIFLFNNGFRVFPMGEPGDDPFGIDRRKAQGYARHLGTRELIGQIELWGINEHFVESSSRNQGFIESSGINELNEYFIETLTKLERYVAPILWKIKERTGDSDESIDYDAKTQILELISKLVGSKNIKLLDYSRDFLNIIDEKTEETPPEVFDYLERIAESTEDNDFKGEIAKTKDLYIKLKKQKEEEEYKRIEAEEKAKEEERKRKDAENKAKKEEELRKEAEYQRLKAEEEARIERAKRVEEERKRRQRESQVRFLESVKSLDVEDVLNLHHQIGIDSNTIDTTISNFKRKLSKNHSFSLEEVNHTLDKIIFVNKKILAVTKFTTKENFMAAARVITDDLISFIKSYIVDIYKHHLGGDIAIKLTDRLNAPFVTQFKPIEFTIIIDNLISNSKRKNAKQVEIIFNQIKNDILEILYQDNGDGIEPTIDNPQIIFERGYTTTRGSGLGLFHVTNILTEMNNSTIVVHPLKKGIEFLINIKKTTQS